MNPDKLAEILDDRSGACPILFGNAVEVYDLTERDIKNFCKEGCCPICSELLEKKFGKRRGDRVFTIDPTIDPMDVISSCFTPVNSKKEGSA